MEDNRPIRPKKEVDQNIDYISPDKLPILQEKQLSQENISLNLKKMIETPKWQLTFEAMIFFRSINKQNPALIKTLLPELLNYLPKLSNSIRSGLSKEAIILVGEILSNFINENTNNDLDIIKKLLYILFQSATNNKKFIKEASMELLENGFIKNKTYFNLDTICIIIDLMKDKKSTVSEICYNSYENLINNVDIKSGNINDNTWNTFFDKINELYNAKKEIYTKKCVKIIEYFENSLGKSNFDELLVKLNRTNDIKNYENWIILGSKKNSTQMSFKDFIKTKKNIKDKTDENN
jgi:hypothetical protein